MQVGSSAMGLHSGLPTTQELSAVEMPSCRISEKPVCALPSRLQRIVCYAWRVDYPSAIVARERTVPSI